MASALATLSIYSKLDSHGDSESASSVAEIQHASASSARAEWPSLHTRQEFTTHTSFVYMCIWSPICKRQRREGGIMAHSLTPPTVSA